MAPIDCGQLRAAHGTGAAGHPPQVMVAADGICRTFGSRHTAVHALRGVSFAVARGQPVASRGRSGSGKTTLLNIIGGLDGPAAGQGWADGREVSRMTERERLALAGLSSHAAHRPDELSGGQQQRVAIGRALAGRPSLLIADEPTSQLDLETGRQIMELLLSVMHSEGTTALVAAHDEALTDLADKVILPENGCVVSRQADGLQALAGDAGTQSRDG